MIVLDASAVVDWLLQTDAGWRIENRIYSGSETLHAPHLLDVEVTQALRRLLRLDVITLSRAGESLRDLIDLRVLRHGHTILLPRVWLWRDNLSAYDDTYLALTLALGATLITRDARLASARGQAVSIELF